jgi:hypothetical protein
MKTISMVMLAGAIAMAAIPAAAQTKLKEITVEQSASPELVADFAKGLSVSPAQAQGAAGALLGQAKSLMSAADFGQVAKAIPGLDGLLAAAPALGGGAAGKLGGMAALAGSFKQLGLDPALVAKAVPILTGFLNTKGAGGAAKALAAVLK